MLCTDGDIRLMVSEDSEYFYAGEADYDAAYYDKDGLRVGRVEMCMNGHFGTICYDSWDYTDVSIACTQLGFSPHGKFFSFG